MRYCIVDTPTNAIVADVVARLCRTPSNMGPVPTAGSEVENAGQRQIIQSQQPGFLVHRRNCHAVHAGAGVVGSDLSKAMASAALRRFC